MLPLKVNNVVHNTCSSFTVVQTAFRFYVPLDESRPKSLRRRSSQPISWHMVPKI